MVQNIAFDNFRIYLLLSVSLKMEFNVNYLKFLDTVTSQFFSMSSAYFNNFENETVAKFIKYLIHLDRYFQSDFNHISSQFTEEWKSLIKDWKLCRIQLYWLLLHREWKSLWNGSAMRFYSKHSLMNLFYAPPIITITTQKMF